MLGSIFLCSYVLSLCVARAFVSLSYSLMWNSDVCTFINFLFLSPLFLCRFAFAVSFCRSILMPIQQKENLNRHTHSKMRCDTGIFFLWISHKIKCNVCIASWEQHFGNGISIVQISTTRLHDTHTHTSAKVLSSRHMSKSTRCCYCCWFSSSFFACVCLFSFCGTFKCGNIFFVMPEKFQPSTLIYSIKQPGFCMCVRVLRGVVITMHTYINMRNTDWLRARFCTYLWALRAQMGYKNP